MDKLRNLWNRLGKGDGYQEFGQDGPVYYQRYDDSGMPQQQTNYGGIQTSQPSVVTQTLTVDDVLEIIGFGAYQRRIIALAGLAWMAESMTVNVLGVLGPEMFCRWHLSPRQEALVSGAGFVGLMIGCILFGWIFDRFGRRYGMLLSVGWSAIYALIAAISPRYIWLIITIFLMTIGAGASSLAAVFSTEFIPAKMRSTSICIMNMFWAAGACLTAVVALVTMGHGEEGPGWRLLMASCAVPLGIFVLIGLSYLPETPRFALASGNPSEAIISLKKIAEINGKHVPMGDLISEESTSMQGSLREILKPGIMLRTTFTISVVIFVVRFSYYGTILQTTEIFQQQDVGTFCELQTKGTDLRCAAMCQRLHSSDYLDLLFTTLAEFPGLALTYLIVDLLGRRRSLFLVLSGVALSYSVLFTCPNRAVTDIVFFIARALSISSFNTIVLYGAEIYPTNIRAVGLGFCNFIGGSGMLFAPLVSNVVSKTSAHLATAIFVGFGCIGAIAAACLPLETTGMKLGEIRLKTR